LPRTLTKANIMQSIAEYNGYSKDESKDIVETLLEIMKRTLESGEDVMISGFGKFCIQDKKKRRGRNPATGDEMILDARRVVSFKCSGKLREMVNKG
jgi:integration host factor subunit alpha